MRNLLVHQKLIILKFLVTVLLAFTRPDSVIAQKANNKESNEQIIETRKPIDKVRVPMLSTKQIYDKGIRSTIWIIAPDGSSASGVLINKELKLAVTNEHVVKDHPSVEVVFPLRNRDGTLIKERTFYKNENYREVLAQIGYITTGHIITKSPNSSTDLAIVEIAGIPETAEEIDYADPDFNFDDYQEVHILGHPAERPLWNWKLGSFKEYDGKDLHIETSAWYGDSGGPVLNKQGRLIGITKAINQERSMWAVPLKEILALESQLAPRLVFSIYNSTGFTIDYEVQWTANSPWEKPKDGPLETGEGYIHWPKSPEAKVPSGYPKIRFDEINDDQELFGAVHELKTNTRRFAADIEDRIRGADAYPYHFRYDFEEKKIYLREGLPPRAHDESIAEQTIVGQIKWLLNPKNPFFYGVVFLFVFEIICLIMVDYFFPKKRHTFSIKNNTEFPIDFQIKWTKRGDWSENYSIRSGALKTHWQPGVVKKKPQIRFNDGKEAQRLTLETYSRRFGRHADDRVSSEDGRKYNFEYNAETKTLNLCVSK